MPIIINKLFISLLLFCLLTPQLSAKETNVMGLKFAALNQTIDKHKKKAARLNIELTSALDRVRKIDSPDEAQSLKNESLEIARGWLSQTRNSFETTKNYLHILTNSEKIKRTAEKNLKKNITFFQQGNIRLFSLDKLNNVNNQAVIDLESERNRRNDLEMQLTKLNDRRENILSEITALTKRLTTLKQTEPAKNHTDPNSATKPKSSDLVNSIEFIFISQKLLEFEWEQRSFDIRRDVLRNERQLSEKNVLSYEKNAEFIQQALNLARTKAASESIVSAEISSKKSGRSHPLLQEVLNINQNLAAESADITVAITTLSTEKLAIEQELERYHQNFNAIKEKIGSTGLSETIGIRLRNAKNQLPDLSTFSQRLKKRRNLIEKVQLRRIELEDRTLELVNITGEINDKLQNSTFTSAVERKKVRKQLKQILNEQKNKFLPDTLKIYDNYFEKILVPIFETEKEYVSLIKEYTEYINERIFWVKSSQIFGFSDLVQSFKSLAWLFSPSSWVTVIRNLLEIAGNNLFSTIIISLLFIYTFFIRDFFVKNLTYFGRYKTKLSLATFSDSLMAGALTVALAAYWPLLLWIISFSIINSQSADIFTHAIAEGLLASANVLFFILLFMQIVRRSGLAETHFRWKEHTTSLIKHQLVWFAPAVIPFVFILQTTNSQPIQMHFDSLGRISFTCITLMLTVLIYNFVNPKTGLFNQELQQHKDGWLNRTRFIWLPLSLLLPLALSITSISGYLYTATELMLLIITSLWGIVAAIILHEFLIRWLHITQRKLMVSKIRKKISTSTDPDFSEHATLENATLVREEAEIDLGNISHQTIKLLNNLTGFAIITGLYLLWADILPALNMLENITLWESNNKLSDGQIITSTITLANGLAALAILLITTLIGTNIPGLLEIAILQRLPFTPSARYGITTIARYLIIIVGTLLTFSAIGIGWAKVQWLVAAITVGLGFGLQEIFANFVSGIIILIERQIRVGDAVTVGNISGRVSRIKMRATTVIDWDRKELIIPNKEFVTGQVINWTLSDTIIRLVIPVGIAYGSDTKKAHDILINIAKNNKYVLEDPQPEAIFSSFGDSTLDFELRIFLPNSDLRVATRHDLLMQIDHEFREENIEIAFPQRDIHIRSVPKDSNLNFGG